MGSKSFFSLLCLAGIIFIIFYGVPVVEVNEIRHIGLFTKNQETLYIVEDFRNVNYQRFMVYIIIWVLICFLLFQTINNARRSNS